METTYVTINGEIVRVFIPSGPEELAALLDACTCDLTYEADSEPQGSHDYSDDGDALASAGMGTDEDYGSFDGGDDY